MKKTVITFLAVLVFVSGCAKSVPKCSDSRVTDLVAEIADREMKNQIGEDDASGFKYTVGAIRTTATNEQTGAHECAAELGINHEPTGESSDLQITYTVEVTDDGNDFYVNVFGL